MSHEPARLRRRTAAVMLVAFGVLCLTAASAFASTGHGLRRVRVGNAPTLPANATPLAGVASTQPMAITVALRPRSQSALDSYAAAVTSPRSPYFHHYLTTAQFRARFAPTTATVQRVESSLRRHGLSPGTLDANGLALHLSANSAALEQAFSVTMARVRAAGRDVTYATRAPALDASVAGAVQAVIGLNGFARETPQLLRRPRSTNPFLDGVQTGRSRSAHVITGGPQPCTAASNAENSYGGFTADQIASAYGFSGLYHHGDYGRGVTVALYELEPNLKSDIAAYQSCYGTSASVDYVRVDGGAPASLSQGGVAGVGEAALDIEQVVGLAPRAKVLVYQGPNNYFGPYDVTAAIVTQDRASVVSTSWGDCEALVGAAAAKAEGDLFAEATVQGQTWLAAAGDSGSEDCNGASDSSLNDVLGVDDPGSQPFVTSVGGTTITQTSPSLSEVVWNDGTAGGAGGGGLSELWNMPSYQTGAPSSLHVIRAGVSNQEGCGPTGQVPSRPYCRQVPDVSADADPNSGYLIDFNVGDPTPQPSGWQVIGGTSAAAPLWAALIADANSSSACSAPIGFANGALYRLAGQSQSTYFHDIVSGNNDMTATNGGLFAAASGYDMASGLGTPIASALGPALCAQDVTVSAPAAQRTFRLTPVTLRLHTRLGSGLTGTLRYGADNLPSGVKLNSATGEITGRPNTVGVRTVTVDAYTSGQIYGSARFVWTVEARPRVSHISLTGALTGRPRLAFTVTAGRREPALRSIRVRLPGGLGPTSRLGSLQVRNRHGHVVRRRVQHHGRTVTVRLSQRMDRFTLVFVSGSLYATRGIRSDARRAHPIPLEIQVTPIDSDGGNSPLHPLVRPRP